MVDREESTSNWYKTQEMCDTVVDVADYDRALEFVPDC